MTDRRHAVARCRWCGSPFKQVYDWQWICETAACAERQIACAVRAAQPLPDRSPFLFLPLPLQVDIEAHPVKRLLVHGPSGIGKSICGRRYAYKRCLQIPGFRVLLLRCTYDELYKNHLQYIPAEAKALGATWTGLSGPQARQLKFAHGDDPEAIMFCGHCADAGDIQKHVGPEWDLVLPEEGVTFLPQGLREITARDRGNAESRPFRDKIGLKGQTRILTNPGGRAMMYLRDLYIDKTPDRDDHRDYDPSYYAHIAGDITDNPYLEEDFARASLGHLDHARFAQLAEGRWDAFEGQFFPEFTADRHVQAIEAPR